MSIRENAHAIARQAGTEIKDPRPVVEALKRSDAYAALKQEPAPVLDLLNLQPKDWDKRIAEHAAAVNRHQIVSSLPSMNEARRHVANAEHRAADEYLAQLAPIVDQAVTDLTDAGAQLISTDPADAIRHSQGDILWSYQKGLNTIGAYASLLAEIRRGLKSDADGGLSVWTELAVIDPGTIPTEVRRRDSLVHETVNPEHEHAHIIAARTAIRAPRTTIAELIADVARGEAHDKFTISPPMAVTKLDARLHGWDAANSVVWAEEVAV